MIYGMYTHTSAFSAALPAANTASIVQWCVPHDCIYCASCTSQLVSVSKGRCIQPGHEFSQQKTMVMPLLCAGVNDG
jgi:hypothetical protein